MRQETPDATDKYIQVHGFTVSTVERYLALSGRGANGRVEDTAVFTIEKCVRAAIYL
jgi:hypothetical protein